jgi:hypothetical protein
MEEEPEYRYMYLAYPTHETRISSPPVVVFTAVAIVRFDGGCAVAMFEGIVVVYVEVVGFVTVFAYIVVVEGIVVVYVEVVGFVTVFAYIVVVDEDGSTYLVGEYA